MTFLAGFVGTAALVVAAIVTEAIWSGRLGGAAGMGQFSQSPSPVLEIGSGLRPGLRPYVGRGPR